MVYRVTCMHTPCLTIHCWNGCTLAHRRNPGQNTTMTVLANNSDKPLNREFQTALRDNRIPPCPVVLERIAQEMDSPEPDFRHLTQIISSDVALAAGLVKLTNSPYFGAQRRIASV